MLCRFCAANIDKNTNFCENCGNAVSLSEYPTIELVSSGPMKYRKTNLDIARLDLEKIRIDLNEKYSGYVIPVSEPFYSGNTIHSIADYEKKKTDLNKSTARNSNIVADMPDYNIAALPVQTPKNPPDAYYRSSTVYSQMRRNTQQAAYTNSAYVSNDGDKKDNSTEYAKTGAFEFVLSLIAMFFMGMPVASLIISVIALKSASKLDKTAGFKGVATGFSLFAFVMSILMILTSLSR